METTINMRIDIFDTITKAAYSRGISRSELITQLIKKAMDDIPDPGRMGTMVKYQEKRNPEEWHPFHLSIRMDDYEYFLDLRKLRKMSVSLILAYAVGKYLKKIKTLTTDNYGYKHYTIIKEFIDDTICWKFIWGFPPGLQKLLLKDSRYR